MTANQINFAKVQEQERTDRANELENQRHNQMMEFINLMNAQTEQAKVAETTRSNLAREGETFRSNNMNYDVNHERNEQTFHINLMDQAVQEQLMQEKVRHDKAEEVLSGVNTAASFIGKIIDVAGTLARGAMGMNGFLIP